MVARDLKDKYRSKETYISMYVGVSMTGVSDGKNAKRWAKNIIKDSERPPEEFLDLMDNDDVLVWCTGPGGFCENAWYLIVNDQSIIRYQCTMWIS